MGRRDVSTLLGGAAVAWHSDANDRIFKHRVAGVRCLPADWTSADIFSVMISRMRPTHRAGIFAAIEFRLCRLRRLSAGREHLVDRTRRRLSLRKSMKAV